MHRILKKVMEKYPDLKASITAPDGHIYTLPGIDNLSHSTSSYYVDEWILVRKCRG